MANETNEQNPMQISTSDELSRGRYSNTMLVAHGPEEFILDWLLNSPNGTHLVSRVIVTPGHMKRISNALQENIRLYEQTFGEIKVNEPPPQMLQ
ncbi:MAG: DUF3467 domain-containing protein [Syntrophus sp. (in: bacteria)]|nr:DUF3467 domain-containing protein [Syntrophus sp. (in: bacteria)]